MKLTEAKLKQMILEVLEEEAKGLDDLKYSASIGIGPKMSKPAYVAVKEDGGQFIVYYSDKNGKELNPKSGIYGKILMIEISKFKWSKKYPCNNGMVIRWSQAAKGFGPLLYDVAIEVATIISGGLTPDRTSVSDDAYKIWDYYLNRRSGDVKTSQLDNEENELTKQIEKDNCIQKAAVDYETLEGVPWEKSALSKIYRKPPTTLKTLRDSKRLILKNTNLSF